jgi:predicted MFS family arabinose efflux permease
MASVKESRLNPFHAVVCYRNFRLLWSASIIMQISEWVQTITLGWLALNLTNSAAFVGRVNFMSGLPLLLLSLPAGALLDRVDRRHALIGCQISGAIIALTIALAIGSSTIAPWHLLVTAVLNGSLLAVSVPATQALVPSLVERDDLTNALGLNAAGGSSTRIIGPSLGGVIIGAVGTAGCFLVQAAGLLIAAVLSLFMRTNEMHGRQLQQAAAPKRRNRLSVIRQDRMMVGLLLQAVAPGLLAYPVLAFIPVLARDHLGLGPAGLGLLMAASGVGAVLGSVIVAMLGTYPHKGRLLMVIGSIYGFVLTAFAQSPWALVSGLLFACSSCLGVSHNALTTALLQARAPEELRGQVTGALTLSFGLSPIGALGIGQLAEQIGVSNAISCGAIACSICIGLTMLCYPKLLKL